jgi:hypothetical protein
MREMICESAPDSGTDADLRRVNGTGPVGALREADGSMQSSDEAEVTREAKPESENEETRDKADPFSYEGVREVTAERLPSSLSRMGRKGGESGSYLGMTWRPLGVGMRGVERADGAAEESRLS